MRYGVKVRVWGDMALFSRPEMKVERYSYDVMTPSSARGILTAIFWHPGLEWKIDKIHVVKPIKFISIRRNEVKLKASAESVRKVMNGDKKILSIHAKENIVQRSSVCLKDVEYVIHAHFEMTSLANKTDNHVKFTQMIKRRLEAGSCYHMPYFGCREFPANFEICEDRIIQSAYANEIKDLGIMFYDFDFSDLADLTPMFFRAVLDHGVIDLKHCEVIR